MKGLLPWGWWRKVIRRNGIRERKEGEATWSSFYHKNVTTWQDLQVALWSVLSERGTIEAQGFMCLPHFTDQIKGKSFSRCWCPQLCAPSPMETSVSA